MRDIVEVKTVYNYNELSDDAKEEAKEDFLNDGFRNEVFAAMLEEDLKHLFPNSDLKYQYSLCNCQGDGLNVYGRLELEDFLNVFNIDGDLKNVLADFTQKEIRTIKNYMQHYDDINLPENSRYTYFITDQLFDLEKDLIYELEDCGYKNINKGLIKRFHNAIVDTFEEYCQRWEDAGYEYIYNITDEEMEKLSSANGLEYTADGKIY